MTKQISLSITLEPEPEIPAFGAFLAGTTADGKPRMVINFGAIVMACADNDMDASEFRLFFAETVVHEMLHMVQEIYGQAFDEDEVEQAIEQGREYLLQMREAGEA